MTSFSRGLRAVPFVALLSASAYAEDAPVDPEIPKLVDKIQPNLPAPRAPSRTPSSPSSPSSRSSPSSPSSPSEPDKPKPPREEPDPKLDEKWAWGAFGSRAMGGGFIASGEDIARAPTVTARPPGALAGPPDATERRYDRAGGYIGLEFATENTTIFDDAMLLGAELWLQGGVVGGARYKDGTFRKNDDGDDKKLGFFVRSDAVVSLAPLNWSGVIAGRFTLFPGVGGVFDSGRYYESYVYLLGGGRLSLLFGGKVALHGQYAIAPFTSNSAYSVLEHRFEGAFSYKKFILGFRGQIDAVGEGDTKATGSSPKDVKNITLGGFIGVGFR